MNETLYIAVDYLTNRSDFERASYLTLEASHKRWETIEYLPLEEGETGGFYSIALCFPDSPPLRQWQSYAGFADAIEWLQEFRDERPELRIYLRCQGVQTEILGADVLRGLIDARASVSADLDDDDDEWQALAGGITAGTLALTGTSFSPFFADMAERFTA